MKCDIVVYSSSKSKIIDVVKKIFSKHKYTVYFLKPNEFFQKSWISTSKYVIIESYLKNEPSKTEIEKLIFEILNCDNLQTIAVSDWILDSYKGKTLIKYLKNDLIVYQFPNAVKPKVFKFEDLDTLEKTSMLDKYLEIEQKIKFIKKPSSMYFICNPKINSKLILKFGQNVDQYFKYDQTLYSLVSTDSNSGDQQMKCLLKSLEEEEVNIELSFDAAEYFKYLNSDQIGQIVIYSEVLESSYKFMEKLLELGNFLPNLIVISRYQTNGTGRKENFWISPDGCAMFTLMSEIPISSPLGSHVAILQHVMAVSIVEAFEQLTGIKNELKIKWPNDVYWSNHGKISGIICKISTFHKMFYAIIGCGTNLSNEEPTVCLNQIIASQSNNSSKLTSESLIASIVTLFYSNIQIIQSNHHALQIFKEKYYKFWLHQNQKVAYNLDGKLIDGIIKGIDDFGYLKVEDPASSIPIYLHPDGNSFDMMHNLIVPK